MTPQPADRLRRLGALGPSDLSRDEHFAHATAALAALPLDAPNADREIALAWLDAIMQAVEKPLPAQIVWFPAALRHHLLAPTYDWPERRFGDWVVTCHPYQGQRVACRREDLIETIRIMQRGYLVTVHPGVIGAPWAEMEDHAQELGGRLLDSGNDWWLPRLDAATMFRLRWVDACDGLLRFMECAQDQRCDLAGDAVVSGVIGSTC